MGRRRVVPRGLQWSGYTVRFIVPTAKADWPEEGWTKDDWTRAVMSKSAAQCGRVNESLD